MPLALVLLVIAAGSAIEYDRIGILQASQGPLNQVFRTVPSICSEAAIFDDKLIGNEGYVHRFWCPSGKFNSAGLEYFRSKSAASGHEMLFVTAPRFVVPDDKLKLVSQPNSSYVILSSGSAR